MSSRQALDEAMTTGGRDALLGRALSRKTSVGAISLCPSLEEVAALTEGSVAAEKRDPLLRHLAGCERCFELFQTASALMDRDDSPAKKGWFTTAAIAAATVAVLAVVGLTTLSPGRGADQVAVSIQERGEGVPTTRAGLSATGFKVQQVDESSVQQADLPTAKATAEVLSGRETPSRLAELVTAGRSSARAYGEISAEKLAFRLGVLAVDLEVLLMANDREGATEKLKQVAEMVPTGKDSMVDDRLAGILAKLKSGRQCREFAGCTDALGEFATRGERLLYDFGVWAEGGHLATLTGEAVPDTARHAFYFQQALSKFHPPSGVVSALIEIESRIAPAQPSEKEFTAVMQNFENILSSY